MPVVQILLGLAGLSVVVFIHELGHFILAKLARVEVEAFSIGWGKVLFSFKHKSTEYRLSLFPLGGYCKLKGEAMFREALEKKLPEIPREEGGFYAASPWRRILISLGGPLFNIISAILASSIIWFVGHDILTFPSKIILESDYPIETAAIYPATLAGLQSGDIILSINQKNVASFRDIQEQVLRNPGAPLLVTASRNGNSIAVTVVPELDKERGAGRIGIYPWVEPVVSSVKTGSAASLAGLLPQDRILSLNGIAIPHQAAWVKALSSLALGSKAALLVERSGKQVQIEWLTSEQAPPGSLGGLSFSPLLVHTPRYSILEATGRGFSDTLDTATAYLKGLGLLFSGINLFKAVTGPVRITVIAGEAASHALDGSPGEGIFLFLNFLVFISIALAIMNLLPIPVLDGGQIVLFLFEAVRRKAFKPKAILRYQTVGMALVFGLIIIALLGDVFYFFKI